MAASTMPVKISADAQLRLASYTKLMKPDDQLRTRMEMLDVAYMRESDVSAMQQNARAANQMGDTSKIQNIEMPVVMPAVEAGVTYQASVFLTGSPMFGVSAAPDSMDMATQLETVIDEQAIRGRWTREFMLAFRDMFKYNLTLMEVSWVDTVTTAFDTDLKFSATQGKPKEVVFSGNAIKRLSPYNTFFDMRVAPADLHTKGEFAGYIEHLSRVQLKTFLLSLKDARIENFKAAFESGSQRLFYEPTIRKQSTINRKAHFDWDTWSGKVDNGTTYKNDYEVRTVYARIIPEDFGMSVPARATPQIWKFIFVNDQVMVYSERQTNAHNYLPILCAQAIEDGLDFQTKGTAENVLPIQQLSTALMTSVLAARRRAISDRAIYDPSRIAEHHVNNPNPSAKIPVRPAAYGEAVQNAYMSIPFRDDQSQIIVQEISQLGSYANVITGQNPARQGQFVKGNKTTHEFDSVMANANGRDQLTAMLIESVLMTPLKEIIKINILQYQGGTSLYNREDGKIVDIDPLALRKAVLDFDISDGLVPKDKQANTEALQTALQIIGSSPAISGAFNVAPLFSYIMKLQGATELKSFEKTNEQLQFEQATKSWQETIIQMAKDNPEIKTTQMPPQPKPADYGVPPPPGQGPQPGQLPGTANA